MMFLARLFGFGVAGFLVWEIFGHKGLPWKPSSALADTSHDPPAEDFQASSGISYHTFTWPAKASAGLTYTLAVPYLVSGGPVVGAPPWVSYSNTQSTGLRLLQASGRAATDLMQQQVMRDFGILAQ